MAFVMVFTSISVITMLVSTTEASLSTGESLTVELTSNRSFYTLFGIMRFTATITNTSDRMVNNISAEAIVGESLRPLSRRSNFTESRQSLAPGESFSFTFNASMNELKSFDRILLPIFWITSLFHGETANISDNGFDNGRNLIQVQHDVRLLSFVSSLYDTSVTVRVWYENSNENETTTTEPPATQPDDDTDFTQQELADMQTVRNAINEILASDAYLQLTPAQRAEVIVNRLTEFVARGLVEEGSVQFNENENLVVFRYPSGGLAGVKVVERTPGTRGAGARSTNTAVIEREEIYATPINTTTTPSALILWALDLPGDRDDEYPWYVDLEAEWNSRGLQTTRRMGTILNFRQMAGYDLIVIAAHGLTFNGVPAFVTNERIISANVLAYTSDIRANRIGELWLNTEESVFTIFPQAITYWYANEELSGSIVIAESCQIMGAHNVNNGVVTDMYSNAFLNAGAETFISFYNNVLILWVRPFSETFVDRLLREQSAELAFLNAILQHGENDGQLREELRQIHPTLSPIPAVPHFRGNEEARLIDTRTGTFTATVIDGGTNQPLSGVTVRAFDASERVVAETITSESGGFSFALPAGQYMFEYTKAGFDTFMHDMTITPDSIHVLQNPIVLSRFGIQPPPPFTTTPMVAGGNGHTVALRDDGTVWYWGTIASFHRSLSQIQGLSNVTAIATGVSGAPGHLLALRYDGTVWAYGSNWSGQLGDGTIREGPYLTQVRNLNNVIAISAGWRHSVALREDGTVWSWGGNDQRQLGNGTGGHPTDHSTSPVQAQISNVVAIATGVDYTIALRSDNTIWTWGHGRLSPTQVASLDNVSKLTRSLALLNNGIVLNWSIHEQIPNISDITALTSGSLNIALRNDGTVWTWGNRPIPQRVQSLNRIMAISVGNAHYVAVREDGTVWAWGENGSGQLGDGTTTNHFTFIQVPNLNNIATISAGRFYTIALRNDGTVWTWGNNSFGQLGDGTIIHRNTPIQVVGPNGEGYFNVFATP